MTGAGAAPSGPAAVGGTGLGSASGQRLPSGPNLLAAGFAVAALLAAASLLVLDQATSVDANNWLIWARQAATGHRIDLTHGLTTFKALPVLYSMPFARISPQAADLAWMWLVRFSAIACSLMLLELASRRFGLLAGAIAALLPLALNNWVAYAIDGDSEPVCAALLLAALLAFDRRRGVTASALLSLACLIRPEALPLALAAILWQAASGQTRGAVTSAAIAAGLGICGWVLVPEIFGTSFGKAASGAKSTAFVPNAKDGFLSLLPSTAWVLVALGLWGIWRRRDWLMAATAAACAVWIAEVVVMGALGWSGLDRYMMPAIICLLPVAAAGVAVILELIPNGTASKLVGATLLAGACALVALAMPLNVENVEARQATADSAGRAVEAFSKAGGMKVWGSCIPFAGNGGYSLIVARKLGVPYSAFRTVTRAPTLAFIPTRLKSFSNGPQVPDATSSKLIAVVPPDWAVAYFAGGSGCGPERKPSPKPGGRER